MTTVLQQIQELIEKQPGLTQDDLAIALFGTEIGYQLRVDLDCRILVARGKIEQRGQGGDSDRYRYFPKN